MPPGVERLVAGWMGGSEGNTGRGGGRPARRRGASLRAVRDSPPLRRVVAAGWPVVQQTAAAGLAWAIAVEVLDDPYPFFAPIAAVVGLNATLGRRGSNAVRLLIGVVVGIVVGELAILVAGGGVWTLTAATFAAMLVAKLIDGANIVTAQAAVSAILVTAFSDLGEGPNRLVEALIGGGIALAFSQLVFPPNPLRLLRRAETGVLTALADGLRLTADALDRDEPPLAARAVARLRTLRGRLADVDTMRKASDRIVRHSVTWRSRQVPVVHERESAEHLDLLAGSCLTLARTAPATTGPQRTALAPGVRELARALSDLAGQPGSRAIRQAAAERALQLAGWVTEHGGPVPAESPMAAAGAAVRMVALDVMIFAGVEAPQARELLDAVVREVQVADRPDVPGWRPPRWPRWRREGERRAPAEPQQPSAPPTPGSGPEEPAG